MREPLIFKVADHDEKARAIRFQEEVYKEELGHAPDDSRWPAAHYLIALDADQSLLATARLVGPDQRPFEIERYVDLSSLFPANCAVALAGRLCVHPAHRRVPRSMFILTGLLKLTYAFATNQAWTDLIIYPRTELVEFYRGALFEESGLTFVEPDFDLEMHVMVLQLKRLERRLALSKAPLARLLRSTSPT